MDKNYIITQNCGIVNFFLNHPDIVDNVNYDDYSEYIDVSDILKNTPYIIFYFPQKGCLLSYLESDNMWETEIFFFKGHRGKTALEASKAVIDYMFNQLNAKGLRASIPIYNKPSSQFVRSLGFRLTKVEKENWCKQGVKYDVEVYEMLNEQNC